MNEKIQLMQLYEFEYGAISSSLKRLLLHEDVGVIEKKLMEWVAWRQTGGVLVLRPTAVD